MTHAAAFRPAWTPLTIALMVLGFVVFWPAGLAMLAYILWGDRLEEMFRDARDQFGACGYRTEARRHGDAERGDTRFETSCNSAFDAYRDREIERLEEERAEFEDLMRDLRHARDREEFDRFMADNGRPRRSRDK